MKECFLKYIAQQNTNRSGTLAGYPRAIEALNRILGERAEPPFNISNIWEIDSSEFIADLREYVLEQQKIGRSNEAGIFLGEVPEWRWKRYFFSAALDFYHRFLVDEQQRRRNETRSVDSGICSRENSEVIEMSMEKLRDKRRKWVEANRENGFEEGINRLLTELYPDNAHFIYELLQNAEDAGATKVKFSLCKDRVEFRHDGKRLFAVKDADSITSIGVSTKREDHTSIGKFGVGFKAVFAYTDTPEIHSGDYHFRIHDLVVPETDNVPRPTMDPAETLFIFPFNNRKKPPQKAFEEIKKGLLALDSNALLFLRHIRKVEYRLPDDSIGSMERMEKSGGQITIRLKKPGDEKYTACHRLRFEKEVEVVDEDGKSKSCRIAIAYRLAKTEDKKGWKITQAKPGRVAIYFPAEKETSNLKFHLHAPFASTVARDSVRDCDANNLLRDYLADLVVKSLFSIRDQGLLTVDFLAVLPNPQDNLSPFYEAIRKGIIKAFKEKDLTPTKRGTHEPAELLCRGPVAIQDVIDDGDLSFLFGLLEEDEFSWVKNPPQKNQREDRFLENLAIEEWGWSKLGNVIWECSYDDEKRASFEEWIKGKSDAWLMKFYALLGEAHDQHDEFLYVSNIRIIRVQSSPGDQHVKPNEAFFPYEPDEDDDEIEVPDDVLFVKEAVYKAGRSEPQKRNSKSFLEAAGVRIYDEKAETERILDQYRSETVVPKGRNSNHVRQFIAYWKEDKSRANHFEDVAFLKSAEIDGKSSYCKPCDLYMDQPYADTGLDMLFNDENLEIKRPKKRLSDDYESIRWMSEFAEAIGVMRWLEIVECPATSLQKKVFPKVGNSTTTTVDKDYYVIGPINDFFDSEIITYDNSGNGFFLNGYWNAKPQNTSFSRAIWLTMCAADPKVLAALYVPNKQRQNEEKSVSSFLVKQLIQLAWIPDREGNFHTPADMTKETLHPDFVYDDRNGWLTAIGFGKNEKEQSEEYQRLNKVLQENGIGSVDEAKENAKIVEGLGGSAAARALVAQRKAPAMPKKSVANSGRRGPKVEEDALNAPSRDSVQRERRIQQNISKVVAEAKAYLRHLYTNEDDELICQCCRSVMPFKIGGDYYFEAIQCIEDKDRRHFQNRLALCPTCSAMYRHARETKDDELIDRIIEDEIDEGVESVEIPVRLAGKEYNLYFVGTHWFDLRTILKPQP